MDDAFDHARDLPDQNDATHNRRRTARSVRTSTKDQRQDEALDHPVANRKFSRALNRRYATDGYFHQAAGAAVG